MLVYLKISDIEATFKRVYASYVPFYNDYELMGISIKSNNIILKIENWK